MTRYIQVNKENIVIAVSKQNVNNEFIKVRTDEDIHVGYDFYIEGRIIHNEEYDNMKQKAPLFEQILNLKKELKDLDYKTIKFIEGQLTEEEFESIKERKNLIREEINRLEDIIYNNSEENNEEEIPEA